MLAPQIYTCLNWPESAWCHSLFILLRFAICVQLLSKAFSYLVCNCLLPHCPMSTLVPAVERISCCYSWLTLLLCVTWCAAVILHMVEPRVWTGENQLQPFQVLRFQRHHQRRTDVLLQHLNDFHIPVSKESKDFLTVLKFTCQYCLLTSKDGNALVACMTVERSVLYRHRQ